MAHILAHLAHYYTFTNLASFFFSLVSIAAMTRRLNAQAPSFEPAKAQDKAEEKPSGSLPKTELGYFPRADTDESFTSISHSPVVEEPSPGEPLGLAHGQPAVDKQLACYDRQTFLITTTTIDPHLSLPSEADMPHRRRLDQGPEPSAADIYPEDAVWAAQQPQAASSNTFNAAQPAEQGQQARPAFGGAESAGQPAQQVEVPASTTPQLSFAEMRAKLDALNAGNPPLIRWPAKDSKEPAGTPGLIVLPGLGIRSLDGRPLPGLRDGRLAGNTSTTSQRVPPRGQPPKPDPSSHDASTSLSLASLRSLNADNPAQPIQRRKATVDSVFKSEKPGERLHLFGPKQSGPSQQSRYDWETISRYIHKAPEPAPTSSDERALSPAQQDGSRYGIQTGIGHGADWKGMQVPGGYRNPFSSDKKTFAPDKNAFYSADKKPSSADKKPSSDTKPSSPDKKSSSLDKKQFSPGKKQ